jgi:electron transport complex protein RnfG
VREILRLIVVLTAICFVAAIALSQVYEFTKEPIAHQKRLEMLRAIRVVLPEVENEPDRDVVRLLLDGTTGDSPREMAFFRGRVNERVAGIAFVVESREGYGGNIEIMLGLDPNESILGVEILSHRETPGLGAKIIDRSFKEQFVGRSLKNTHWTVIKDGGDIDQITGATVSPRAVVEAIQRGLEMFRENKNRILEEQPGGRGSETRDQLNPDS